MRVGRIGSHRRHRQRISCQRFLRATVVPKSGGCPNRSRANRAVRPRCRNQRVLTSGCRSMAIGNGPECREEAVRFTVQLQQDALAVREVGFHHKTFLHVLANRPCNEREQPDEAHEGEQTVQDQAGQPGRRVLEQRRIVIDSVGPLSENPLQPQADEPEPIVRLGTPTPLADLPRLDPLDVIQGNLSEDSPQANFPSEAPLRLTDKRRRSVSTTSIGARESGAGKSRSIAIHRARLSSSISVPTSCGIRPVHIVAGIVESERSPSSRWASSSPKSKFRGPVTLCSLVTAPRFSPSVCLPTLAP